MPTNAPSIELQWGVKSVKKSRQEIQALSAAITAASPAVRPLLEIIEPRRGAAEQLLAYLNGLRADCLRERGEIGFPRVLRKRVRPVAPEHQAPRSEEGECVPYIGPRIGESHQPAELAHHLRDFGGAFDNLRPIFGGRRAEMYDCQG